MPRPKLDAKVREAVRNYLQIGLTLPREQAPLNIRAVAHQLGFNRKTLKKYGLDAEIASTSKRQESNGKTGTRESERRSYSRAMHEQDLEIEAMRKRCEALLARVLRGRRKRAAPWNRSCRALETAFDARPDIAPYGKTSWGSRTIVVTLKPAVWRTEVVVPYVAPPRYIGFWAQMSMYNDRA